MPVTRSAASRRRLIAPGQQPALAAVTCPEQAGQGFDERRLRASS